MATPTSSGRRDRRRHRSQEGPAAQGRARTAVRRGHRQRTEHLVAGGSHVGDIDFLARTLRVTRQLQRAEPSDIEAGKNLVEAAGGITVVIRAPKYESERTIYLPDEVVTLLSEHVRLLTPKGGPTRWLFGERGKPWHDNLVDYRWRSTRSDARVTYKLHELRHYFAGDRRRVRRRHRPAGDGPRVNDDDAEHLRALVADG
jgi:hypothetical protein